MKFTLARAARPRNPMVAPARFRQAGVHSRGEVAERQRQQRALASELRQTASSNRNQERTPPDPHSP